MNKHKRIFIVGHPGAGKGVLAQEVAKQLGWKFINADILSCVANVGRKVSEIFGEDGESCFNQSLTKILCHLITQENIVVTTDANIVCDEKARELLKSEFTVYLQVSTPVQIERLSDYRPLLPVKDFGVLLNELHKDLDDLYKKVAAFTLSSDSGDIETHAKNVIKHMQQ